MPTSDWRSAPAYAPVHDQDRGGFSWELLRRNPDYRRDYQQALTGTPPQGASDGFPAVWGLRFRG